MNKTTQLAFCIQCADLTSGKVGSFVYHKQAPFRAVSPVFETVDKLFTWLKAGGYCTGVLCDFDVYEVEPEEPLDNLRRASDLYQAVIQRLAGR